MTRPSFGCRAVIEDLRSGRSFEFPVERAVFATVLHRIMVSGSDRACDKWMADYDLPGVDGLALHHLYPGSFGSRLFEDGERLVAMFGEVLLALDRTVPPASMDGEGGVSQGGEGLGGVARSGAAGVLAAGPIADVVQAVLDSPMPARDVEQ